MALAYVNNEIRSLISVNVETEQQAVGIAGSINEDHTLRLGIKVTFKKVNY